MTVFSVDSLMGDILDGWIKCTHIDNEPCYSNNQSRCPIALG